MAVNLAPNPIWQYEDAAGAPLIGGKLFFYVAGVGSSTKQNTYTDATGATPNTNPLILNSLGQPATGIFFTAGQTYKVVLAPSTDTDPPVSPIWVRDVIAGINDVTATASEWVAGPTPTFVNATQFTLVGDQTSTFQVSRRVKATVTAGTVYGTITASAFAALTTVTLLMDAGALDSGLSSVSYGLLAATNPSVPGTYAKSGANADITSLSVLVSVNGGPIAGFRNAVINGGMQVAQGPNITLTASTQNAPVDMYLAACTAGTGISGSVVQAQNANWASGYALVFSSVSWTAGIPQVFHRIESKNVRKYNGRTINISCKVIQDTGGTRTFSFALRKANAVDNFSAVTAINAGFGATAALTSVATVISGSLTLGASDCDNGLEIVVFDSAANTVVSKNYYFGDLEFTFGSVAETVPEVRPYGMELALARRYYRISSYQVPTSTVQNLGTIDMRAVPTITGGGTGFISTGTTADTLMGAQTTGAVQALTLDARL